MFAIIVLLIWDVPFGLHCKNILEPNSELTDFILVFAYYVLGFTAAVTPILFPWVNIIMKDNAEARAITTGAMV